MERHEALNTFLDVLFQTEDLNSWTGHKNHRGTVLTLRFRPKEAMLDQRDQGNTISYKRKTPYQIKRDFSKLELFRKRKRCASPDDIESIENARSESCDDDILSEPGPFISPVLIKSNNHEECSSSRTNGEESQPICVSSPVNPQHSSIIQDNDATAVIHSQPPEPQMSPDISMPQDILNDACDSYGLDTFSLPVDLENTISDLNDTVLCNICDASAPQGTVMQTCESCDAKLCGHCALSKAFKHDDRCNLIKLNPPDPPDNQTVPPEAKTTENMPTEARPRINPQQGASGDRRLQLFLQAIRACHISEMPDLDELFGTKDAS